MATALTTTTDLCKLLGDPTRLRLLAALSHQPLSVAELVKITGLGQSRVSTHLGKLREADLVTVQPMGGRGIYTAEASRMPDHVARWWRFAQSELADPLLEQDRARISEVVAARHGGRWADTVAGRMARHYSPGRTWPAFARGIAGLIGMPSDGHLLDIASGDGALAELVVPQVASVTCLDRSAHVVAEGRRRLGHLDTLRFVEGDMHDLPFEAGHFHGALLMGALCHADDPAVAINEASRVLKVDGRMVIVTLKAHGHREAVAPYDHVQLGFTVEAIGALLEAAHCEVLSCTVTGREKRPPHFEVITAVARKVSHHGAR
ncbi:MAG: metalloregulator ArsR/SmtB family transcription factor [Bradymonadia bacterium]